MEKQRSSSQCGSRVSVLTLSVISVGVLAAGVVAFVPGRLSRRPSKTKSRASSCPAGSCAPWWTL